MAGIYVSGAGSAPRITDAVVYVSGSSTVPVGIWNVDLTTPTFVKFDISVAGGAGGAIAILNSSTQVSLTEGTASASATGGSGIAVKNLSATVQMAGVIATGLGISGYGLSNDTGTSTVNVDRSTLTGGFRSVFNTNNSVLRIGGSQLVGR